MAVTVAMLALLAVLAAWLNGLPIIIRLILVFGVLVYAVIGIKALLAPAFRRIGIDPSGLVLTDADGASINLAVRGRPFVSPLFIGLVGRRLDNRRFATLGLFREQLAGDDYRRLAAWLRTQPIP